MSCAYAAVPCHKRAAAVEGYKNSKEELLEPGMDDDGDGWVATHGMTAEAAAAAVDDIPDIDGPSSHAGWCNSTDIITSA